MNSVKRIADDSLRKTTNNLKEQSGNIKKISKDGLVKTTISLNRQVKMIQKIMSESIEKAKDKFESGLIPKLKGSIRQTMTSITEVTNATENSGDILTEIFTDISGSFNDAILDAEKKISSVSDNVFESFGDLKDTFSNKIVTTLGDVLTEVGRKLEVSEVTIHQFLDRARTEPSVSFEDIWFIRSTEAVKAHIISSLPLTKARVMIVAPRLRDIDIEPILKLPSRVNVRICTNIDRKNHEDKAMLDALEPKHNIQLKLRAKSDIWGYNKDYEDFIISVVSTKKVAGITRTEIAGFGTTLYDQIQYFVPVLEDAWLKADKRF